jgi:glycogen(starch) synthase
MTADTVGGVWSHALELSRALGAEGVEVVLAALGREPTPAQAQEARAVSNLTLHAAPYRLPWMDDPWDDVRQAGEWLLELAASSHCEMIHLSEPVFGALPWDAPSLAVGHSCVLSWYAAVRGEAAPDEWRSYHRAMRRGLRSADAVVAPSAAMLAALERHYGVHGGSVIRNGRDPARYAPGMKERIVIAAGRLWDPAKNVAALARVAPHLSWPVLAAGDTRSPDGASEAGDSLELLGVLGEEALAGWYARAAIFALPARYEPFGQAILEAALSGCALVLGDIPSLQELWGGAAMFVPPEDPAALQRALGALIRDATLRRRLAARSRHRAREYTAVRMARGYLDLYARLLQAPRHARSARESISCAW